MLINTWINVFLIDTISFHLIQCMVCNTHKYWTFLFRVISSSIGCISSYCSTLSCFPFLTLIHTHWNTLHLTIGEKKWNISAKISVLDWRYLCCFLHEESRLPRRLQERPLLATVIVNLKPACDHPKCTQCCKT